MGNAQSPSTDPRFISATRAFTQKELEDLKSLFVSLAAQSQSNVQYISPSVFKAYFKIDLPLGQRMYDLVTQNRNDWKLTFEDLVIAKGTYEKGIQDEIEDFIYQLLDVTGDGTLSRFDLEAVLVAMLDATFPPKNNERQLSAQKDAVGIFLNTATFSKEVQGCAEKSMSRILKVGVAISHL